MPRLTFITAFLLTLTFFCPLSVMQAQTRPQAATGRVDPGKASAVNAPNTPTSGDAKSGKNPEKRAPRLFLKIQERTQLMLGPVAYRNIGVNIPDLFVRFLRGEDAGATQALMDARAAGAHFVRCWGTAYAPEDFTVFETDRARWLSAFDRMLEAADSADIAVVPSLLYNVRMLPAYVGRNGVTPDTLSQYLTPGSRSNTLALAYVNAVVPRYKDDARVLFWEIGNAYNMQADVSTADHLDPVSPAATRAAGEVVTSDQVRAFLVQIAARIHSLDRRHYVTSGCSDMRPFAFHLRAAMRAGQNAGHALDFAPDHTSDTFAQYQEMLGFFHPNPVDIISVHQSPPMPDTAFVNGGASWLVEDGVHALRLPWTQYAADSLKKPLFVGQFGEKILLDNKEQDAPWTLDFLRRIQISAAPPAALWSWEFDAATPRQAPFTLSPQRTPRLALALTTTNAAILNSAVSGVTIVNPPALDVSKTTQQEDKMRAQSEKLRDIALDVLKSARSRIGDTPVLLPDGSGAAKAFVIRDAALTLGTDIMPADEIAGWVRLIASAQAGANGIQLANGLSVPPYSIPDHLTLAGAPGWFPNANAGTDQGNGEFGYLPPADSAFYFIQMVREHFRLTGQATLFQSQVTTPTGIVTISDACTRAFDSVAADASGLVTVGTNATDWRVDWGFTDTVHKTGAALMPSLLRWRAARDLVLLFAAVGNRDQIARYDKEVTTIQAAITKTFYHALDKENGKDVGMLYSATGQGHKDDLWASAYAVWSGALRSRTADAVAQHLRVVYQAGGSVVEGQVRGLPPAPPLGGYWEQTSTPPDTYQNGAYWAFASGWYIAALLRVDRPAAGQMLDEFVTSLQTHRKDGAPWQCVNPANNYTRLPQYGASVAAPYVALRNALDPK